MPASLRNQKFPFVQAIVIGGTGQTGHRVLELLAAKENLKIVSTSRAVASGLPSGPLASSILTDAQKWGPKVDWHPLDLEAETSVVDSQLRRLGGDLNPTLPTALIFAAAFTNVEACESDPARCKRINETNTLEVFKWARENFKAKLVFYSTDYVFDGEEGPYSEEHKRHAVSQYGQSKVNVEEWLEKNAADALILRTTGVYDYLPGSKNFLMQMLELWGQGKQTRIPGDQFANPVWARDLGKSTVELLEHGSKGIFNVAGGAQLPRTEFALTIARIFGFDPSLIESVRTSDLGQRARRPLKGGLKCDKLKKELGWAPGAAQEVLEALKWEHRR